MVIATAAGGKGAPEGRWKLIVAVALAAEIATSPLDVR
jgi:hypothetical protein